MRGARATILADFADQGRDTGPQNIGAILPAFAYAFVALNRVPRVPRVPLEAASRKWLWAEPGTNDDDSSQDHRGEYNTLPPSEQGTPFNSGDLFSLAKTYAQLATSEGDPSSGAGVAVLEGLTADMLTCVAQGKEPSAVADLCRDKWLEFCEQNNKRVHEAPKVESGPSKGNSVPEHEWCSPVAFASRALFVLAMVPDEEVTVKVFVGRE